MDLDKMVAEQINFGRDAGVLLANPAFKQVVEDLSTEFFRDFRKAGGENLGETLLLAHLKMTVLDQLVSRMESMFEIGRDNSKRAKG